MTLIQQSGYVDQTKLAALLHDTGFEIWAISYFFLSACHYYIGRYVYDFSRPEIRRKLSFGGTSSPSSANDESAFGPQNVWWRM
jgi:hypothetical protein